MNKPGQRTIDRAIEVASVLSNISRSHPNIAPELNDITRAIVSRQTTSFSHIQNALGIIPRRRTDMEVLPGWEGSLVLKTRETTRNLRNPDEQIEQIIILGNDGMEFYRSYYELDTNDPNDTHWELKGAMQQRSNNSVTRIARDHGLGTYNMSQVPEICKYADSEEPMLTLVRQFAQRVSDKSTTGEHPALPVNLGPMTRVPFYYTSVKTQKENPVTFWGELEIGRKTDKADGLPFSWKNFQGTDPSPTDIDAFFRLAPEQKTTLNTIDDKFPGLDIKLLAEIVHAMNSFDQIMDQQSSIEQNGQIPGTMRIIKNGLLGRRETSHHVRVDTEDDSVKIIVQEYKYGLDDDNPIKVIRKEISISPDGIFLQVGLNFVSNGGTQEQSGTYTLRIADGNTKLQHPFVEETPDSLNVTPGASHELAKTRRKLGKTTLNDLLAELAKSVQNGLNSAKKQILNEVV